MISRSIYMKCYVLDIAQSYKYIEFNFVKRYNDYFCLKILEAQEGQLKLLWFYDWNDETGSNLLKLNRSFTYFAN